jgi:hypothetical protein
LICESGRVDDAAAHADHVLESLSEAISSTPRRVDVAMVRVDQ